MPNVDEIHLTGTGQIQEQFMKFLAETPQYKNVVSTESTANKMSDENLIANREMSWFQTRLLVRSDRHLKLLLPLL
jgi:hypothetical protein